MSDGNGDYLFRGLPVWARIILIWGPLSGIAMFATWTLTTEVPAIRLEAAAQRAELQAIHRAVLELKNEVAAGNAIGRWNCAVNAKTDADRKACLSER